MECDLTNRDQYKQVELSWKNITSSRNWLYGLSWTVLRRRAMKLDGPCLRY